MTARTVVLAGTPPNGVGMAAKPPRWGSRPGNTVTIEIDRVGKRSNPVTLER